MDNLNNIPSTGNWGDAASKLNDNFNKVKQAVTTVENVSKNNKGYFTSLSALNTAFPSPKAGQTAYVYGEASSTNYYIYNAVNGAWVASSIEAPSVGVDLAGYTKTGGSSKTTKQVDDEVIQLAGEVSQKASHGYESNPKTLKEVDDTIAGLNGDYFSFTGGYILKNSGGIQPNSSFGYTPFVRIPSNPNIKIKGAYGEAANSYSICAFYDKYYNYISSYNGGEVTNLALTVTITSDDIPANAVYFRASKYIPNGGYIQGIGMNDLMERIDNLEGYNIEGHIERIDNLEGYNLEGQIERIDNLEGHVNTLYGDYFSFTGGYIYKSTGGIQPNSNFGYTPFIRIPSNPNIKIKGAYGEANEHYSICTFYDEYYNYISSYNGGEVTNLALTVTITSDDIPANAVYFRASKYIPNGGYIQGIGMNNLMERIDNLEGYNLEGQIGRIDNLEGRVNALSPYFSEELMLEYPFLSCIKSVKITPRIVDSKPDSLSLTYLSNAFSDSQSMILNVNSSLGSVGYFEQSIVLSASGITDFEHVVYTGSSSKLTVEIIADRTYYKEARDFQADSSARIFFNQNVIDNISYHAFIGKTFVKSKFFEKQLDIVRFPSEFIVDMSFYGRDTARNYYVGHVGYSPSDTPATPYNFIVYSQPREDVGTTDNLTVEFDLKLADEDLVGGIASVHTKNPLTHATIYEYSVILDFSVFDGKEISLHYNTGRNILNDFAWNGGNGIADKKYINYTVADVVRRNKQNDNIGNIMLTKINDPATTIADYNFGEASPISMLKGIKYYNMSRTRLFLDVTWDGKYWFANRDTRQLEYAMSIDDIFSENFTVVANVFEVVPCALRMNRFGELIVILDNFADLTKTYKPTIWLSDTNFTNWVKKMTFDNENAEFKKPLWSLDMQGDRILACGYGIRYTGSSEQVESDYLDVDNKAVWSIYYSHDAGHSWFNRLFSLGETIDINGFEIPAELKSGCHTHGVSIDPYWHRLMVVNGDADSSLWVSTNLEEWEDSQINGDGSVVLGWLRTPIAKSVGGHALKNNLLFGSDYLPNGIYRINKISKTIQVDELAWNESKWAMQRTNADGTGDYGMYGGCFYRRNEGQPLFHSITYKGGVQPDDYKRNMVVATYDGYNFYKIWEDDRDVIYSSEGVLSPLRSPTNVLVRSDDSGNVLIQTADSRFNEFTEGHPTLTGEWTLVIGKL